MQPNTIYFHFNSYLNPYIDAEEAGEKMIKDLTHFIEIFIKNGYKTKTRKYKEGWALEYEYTGNYVFTEMEDDCE